MKQQPTWIPRAGQRIRFVERNGKTGYGVIEEAGDGLLGIRLDDGRLIRSNTGDARIRPVGTKGLSTLKDTSGQGRDAGRNAGSKRDSDPGPSRPRNGADIAGMEIM